MTKFRDDKSLTIKLLRYYKSDELTERYYFLEMSTLQATTLLPQELKITATKIVGYSDKNKYLEREFVTIGDFNDFFVNNPDYYIHDCEITLDNGTIISSHDDGEVSIKLPINHINQVYVESVFERSSLDKSLIEKLKSKPGYYFALDGKNNIIAEFETFDAYLKKGNNYL